MKLVLTSSLFLALLAAVHCQDCDSSQLDICGAQIWPFLVDPNVTPATEQEKETSCLSLYAGDKCVRDFYTKCPDRINPAIRDGVLDSLSSTVKDFCTGSLGKRFVPHGLCMKQNLAKNFTCNTDTVELFEAAAVLQPVTDRLKLTCCSYISLDKCYTAAVTAVCDRAAARVIRNLMQSYAIFMVEKCLPYLADADKCDLSVLKGLKPINGRKMKTFLPALADVATVAF